MRRDYFEDYYKSIGYKTTKLFSNGFDISKIGFLYSDDENAFNKVVLFYTPEKEDLIEYVEQILETSRKSEVDFTVLGYIKKGTNKYLITVNLTTEQKNEIYASEADILNVALFGMTAKQWRESNPNKDGNIRDYASTIELAILSNLEFYNSKLIEENIPPKTRLIILNNEANKEKELFNINNEKVLKITNNE